MISSRPEMVIPITQRRPPIESEWREPTIPLAGGGRGSDCRGAPLIAVVIVMRGEESPNYASDNPGTVWRVDERNE